MSVSFWENLERVDNKTLTTNGCEAYKSTGSYLVDFLGNIASYRKESESEIAKWVDKLYSDDKLAARKLIFYVRDILQGMGERKIARVMLHRLAQIDPENAILNLENVPEFGRFDDLYAFIGTPIEANMWSFIKLKFYEDINHMKTMSLYQVLASGLRVLTLK